MNFQTRRLSSVMVMFVFASCFNALTRGWDSNLADTRVSVVTLGNEQLVSYSQSLDQLYTTYSALAVEPLSNADLTELAKYRPFNTDGGNANIMLRFGNIRRATLDAIDIISFDEPKVADSLYTMYRNNRLGLGFSDDVREDSQLRDDGTGEYGDEALNLFEFPRLQTPSARVKLYDAEMFRLIHTLQIEGLRSVQVRYNGSFPTTQTTFANWSLLNQLAEVNVATKILAYHSYMSNLFNSLRVSLQLPAGANGSGARIGTSILNDLTLTPTQKQNVAGIYSSGSWGNTNRRRNFSCNITNFIGTVCKTTSPDNCRERATTISCDAPRGMTKRPNATLANFAAFTSAPEPRISTVRPRSPRTIIFGKSPRAWMERNRKARSRWKN